MEPIPTPPTENILTTQQIINDVGQTYTKTIDYNDFSSDDSDWEEENKSVHDIEKALYSEDEVLDLISDIDDDEQPVFQKKQKLDYKTDKITNIFEQAENLEKQKHRLFTKTRIETIFDEAEHLDKTTKNTKPKINSIFEKAENLEKEKKQQQDETISIFEKAENLEKEKKQQQDETNSIFEKAEKLENKKKQQQHQKKLKTKPLYYIHVKRKKCCLFCGTKRSCKKINTAGGRDLFFSNRLLVYPNKHHVCRNCEKKDWKHLQINEQFEKEEVLSSAHLNIIENYLTALRKIYDSGDYKNKTKYPNHINIDKISAQQCKQLTKIKLEAIRDMAKKSNLPFKKCFTFWYYLGNIDSWVKSAGVFGPSKSTLNNWFIEARKSLFQWSKTVNNKHKINREYIQKNINKFAKIVLGIEDKPDTCVLMMDSFSVKIQQPSK